MELNKIPGIGPKTEELLNKLNVYNISDLHSFYPYRYNFIKISDINEGKNENIIVVGQVQSTPRVNFVRRNLNILTFQCLVNNIIVKVTIYNRMFLKNNIKIGKYVTLIGKYNKKTNTFTASNIKLHIIKNNTIESVYHLVSGLKANSLEKFINYALKYNSTDYIPQYLNKAYNFIDKDVALKNIHQPTGIKLLKQATLKLIYEELFVFLYKINFLKQENKINKNGIRKTFEQDKVEKFIANLPFTLTTDQLNSIKDILIDLNSKYAMNRLLLGDVGSGKTIVAIVAMYANYLAGYQSAMMAPTEILATQHYNSIKDTFKKDDIKIELLTGSLKDKEKKEIVKKLKNKEIDLIVGTHALISDSVEFNNLGLVITDEQHRFGVRQRENLQNKGEKTDVLYMSATPIPRTYALTLYGDMDLSLLKEKPKNRIDIKTFVKKESEIKDVLTNIYQEIKKGYQVYVVSPLIRENDNDELNDVNSLTKNFKLAFPKKVNIGTLHGQLKNEEKEQIMNDFKNGKIDLLISTTVIEVGVDVKNATTMVIFNAERFGLATLHQLRGRVGRNDLQSQCYLICNKDIERLRVLESSNDGFYISEKDYELRGEGDLFGTRQSGDMIFKIARLPRDIKILLQVEKDVGKFIEDNIENDFKNYPAFNLINKTLR